MTTTIKNVTVVGASGSLGAVMLDALVAAGHFNVTVLKRQSSKCTPLHADKVRVVAAPDSWTRADLTALLRGQDAVVVCVRMRSVDDHLRLADAAAAAGVRRFIPPDFGSVDSRSRRNRELVTLFESKVTMRERCEALAASHRGFTWTSLVCGHFFDWGLRDRFLHFHLDTRTAEILNDGSMRSSNATLARVAEATVRVLERPEATANRTLMIQSFCVSQNDILRSLEKATAEKWAPEYIDAEDFIKEHKAKADAGSQESVEDLVFALGAIDGNWEEQPDFAMDLLSLGNEDLDEVVQRVVDEKRS